MSDASLYAAPRQVAGLDDCLFYHVMEVPGYGVTSGYWDLRQGVDNYLGHVALARRRVLEIGPASGYLTFEMERRGADVVAVEVTDEPGWDFVPYPASFLESVYGPRRDVMRRLKNSFWLAHAAHRSRAKLYYGDVYNLPAALGHFDVALMGAVLLHCHSPLRIVEQCARMADTLIITDALHPELEGRPLCRLVPTPDNREWGTWWDFSSDFFLQFLGVMGFTNTKVTTHEQQYVLGGTTSSQFTIVASR